MILRSVLLENVSDGLLVNFPSLGYEDLDITRMLKDGTLRQWFEGHGEREIETWGVTRRGGVLSREHRVGRIVAGFARQGQLMSSYHTAVDTMVEVENRREARILDSIIERETASERAGDKAE